MLTGYNRIPSIEAKMMESGKYKMVVFGQHDDHIMDYAGCNFRIKTIEAGENMKGQPKNGFDRIEDGIIWCEKRFSTKAEFIEYAGKCGNGAHYSDFDGPELVCIPDIWKVANP